MYRQLNCNGSVLTYWCDGTGPAVVLLHGFGETGAIWEGQIEPLSHYRLIIPDLPGSGRSEMIADMSMEGLAETIRLLLQELQVEQCVLIGHSMGGYIALAFFGKIPGVAGRYWPFSLHRICRQ